MKMTAFFKRCAAAVLAAVQLLLIVSCGTQKAEPDASSGTEPAPATNAAQETGDAYDENGYLLDGIPDDLDFSGQTVSIYVRGDRLNTEFLAEETGDIVDDAVFARNRTIEERLNVTLNYTANTSEDYWGTRDVFLNTVRSSVMADDHMMDIVAGLTNMMPFLAQEHMFRNMLSEVPYIDFSAPWWPDTLIQELAVRDKMYFASGEVCLGVLESMMCIYFNKDIQKSLNLEDPYQAVDGGKWTLDRFDAMLSEAYADLNGNGKPDKEDRFGFTVLAEPQAFNFIYSCGQRVTEKNADGLPEFCCAGENVINVLARLGTIMQKDACPVASAFLADYTKVFEDGRALFTSGVFSSTELYRDLDFDFGVIPYPKYDEQQEAYITTARGDYSCFGVPVTADPEITGAVLEAMASENFRSVTPMYFEKALKVKYSRDNESAQMFDLIRNSVSYDFGYFFGYMFDDIPLMLRKVILDSDETWASKWESKREALEIRLTECLNLLLE